jgi:hypothetical protein
MTSYASFGSLSGNGLNMPDDFADRAEAKLA